MPMFITILSGAIIIFGGIYLWVRPYKMGIKPYGHRFKTKVPLHRFICLHENTKYPNILWMDFDIDQTNPDSMIVTTTLPGKEAAKFQTIYSRIGGSADDPIFHLEEANGKIEPLGADHYLIERIVDNGGNAVITTEERGQHRSTAAFLSHLLLSKFVLYKRRKQLSRLYFDDVASTFE